jgi:hypothetical protein
MNDMRFDCNARIEVWVDEYDIRDHSKYNDILNADISDNQKMMKLRDLAKDIFYKILNNPERDYKGVHITVDSFDTNLDRIDWQGLIEKEEE